MGREPSSPCPVPGQTGRLPDSRGAQTARVNGLASLLSGRSLRATRPLHFFRADGTMPEMIELALTLPSELGPADAVLAELRDRVCAVELERAAERQRAGGRHYSAGFATSICLTRMRCSASSLQVPNTNRTPGSDAVVARHPSSLNVSGTGLSFTSG